MLSSQRGFSRYVNWDKLRAFGQYEILSRASLSLLILIPILAGLWPAVRLAINRYNYAASTATKLLQSASEKLVIESKKIQDNLKKKSNDKVANEVAAPNSARNITGLAKGLEDEFSKKLNDPNFMGTVTQVAKDLEAFIGEHPIRTVRETLPFAWAVLFFASLFITFGKWIYQVRAPQAIREHSYAEHISLMKDDYIKAPTEGAFRNALMAGGFRESREKQLEKLGVSKEPPRPERFIREVSDEAEFKEAHLKWEVEVIMAAAGEDYRLLASLNSGSCLLASLLFWAGLALIIAVLGKQACAVSLAAGWL